jgi:hypothetical protein
MTHEAILEMKKALDDANVPVNKLTWRTTPRAVASISNITLDKAEEYCKSHGQCVDKEAGIYEFKLK